MPIVTFWSNTQKTMGQTVAISSVATAMAMDCSYKILLISVDVNDNQLEKNFGRQQTNSGLLGSLMSGTKTVDIDSGIEGLLRLTRTNRLTPELIKDYTKIITNRLEVLYSPRMMGKDINALLDSFKIIITNAAKYYDYVFVDLKKGINLAKIWEILNMSDVVVFNTTQTQEQMARLLKTNSAQSLFEGNKILWNIPKFDQESKYNLKYLSKKFPNFPYIYNISYDTQIFEATQEGRIANLLLDLRSAKGKYKNNYLLDEIRNLMKAIISRVEEIQRGSY